MCFPVTHSLDSRALVASSCVSPRFSFSLSLFSPLARLPFSFASSLQLHYGETVMILFSIHSSFCCLFRQTSGLDKNTLPEENPPGKLSREMSGRLFCFSGSVATDSSGFVGISPIEIHPSIHLPHVRCFPTKSTSLRGFLTIYYQLEFQLSELENFHSFVPNFNRCPLSLLI